MEATVGNANVGGYFLDASHRIGILSRLKRTESSKGIGRVSMAMGSIETPLCCQPRCFLDRFEVDFGVEWKKRGVA